MDTKWIHGGKGLNEKTPTQAVVRRTRLAETKARQRAKTYSAPRRRVPTLPGYERECGEPGSLRPQAAFC